jgi:mxaK protein
MALRQRLVVGCAVLALLSSALLARDIWHWQQVKKYNTEITHKRFAAAEHYGGAHGVFAKAYAEQAQGRLQAARVLYSTLERADDPQLRVAALFNLGNTYLQQALLVDIAADPDLALPLIELAKATYRELLAFDSKHWDARHNLERALKLLPDSRAQTLIDLEGRRSTNRTIVSGEVEENLP